MTRFDAHRLPTVLAAAAAVLAGCQRQPTWEAANAPARVCVDEQGRRAPEAQCAIAHTGTNPFLWYYLANQNRTGVPAYGRSVAGGGYTPSPGVSYGSAPAAGVARGGFGATAASLGGGEHGGGGGE